MNENLMRYIEAAQVKEELLSGSEIALIDVREYGQYGEGHPFFATNIPYSVLETRAQALLPCLHSHCVLMDQNDGVAERAWQRLTDAGYDNLSILKDGATGWETAGFTLFKGVNLPSKTYGEIVEHELGTPSISAEQLSQMCQTTNPPIILDGRTPQEFQKMNIPGALSLPNAEIGHRLANFVDNDGQTVVVNCAGRTRSILGAQTLRQLDISNPIVALRNGTAGWALAGLDLQHGTQPNALPALSAEMREHSINQGQRYRAQHNVPTIDMAQCEALSKDSSRCCYLLDVRSREEYEQGHLKGSRHAPGGQLVQASDQWVAVRGAKIVLIDDTGLRASTTAGWLRNMGHDAVVLDSDISQQPQLATRADARGIESHRATTETISAAELANMYPQGPTLIDVSDGMSFRAGHIDGAHWGIRPRLPSLLSKLAPDTTQPLILCGANEAVRNLAAIDAQQLGYSRLSQLAADLADCRASGLPVVSSEDQPSDSDCIDYLFFVHDRHDGNLEASRQYLEWETGLLDQVDAQELSVFRTAQA